MAFLLEEKIEISKEDIMESHEIRSDFMYEQLISSYDLFGKQIGYSRLGIDFDNKIIDNILFYPLIYKKELKGNSIGPLSFYKMLKDCENILELNECFRIFYPRKNMSESFCKMLSKMDSFSEENVFGENYFINFRELYLKSRDYVESVGFSV